MTKSSYSENTLAFFPSLSKSQHPNRLMRYDCTSALRSYTPVIVYDLNRDVFDPVHLNEHHRDVFSSASDGFEADDASGIYLERNVSVHD